MKSKTNSNEMTLIEQLRYKTYLEANELLEAYGKACIVRPTGFGKTGILTRFIQDKIDESNEPDIIKVIYLYPTEVIRDAVLRFYYGENNIPGDKTIPNVEFVTYTTMAQMPKSKMLEYDNLELIIADECHRTGAELTSAALKDFLKVHADIPFLGATATPIRMDLVDIVGEYFDDKVTSEYTLHNAFQDGIIQKPYYCYYSYDIKLEFKEIKKRAKKEMYRLGDVERKLALDSLKNNLKEISDISKMDKIIRDVCDKHAKSTDYIKGVIFCSNFKDLHDKMDIITEWFQKAYPTHTVKSLIVTSENSEYKNNVKLLNEFSYRDKGIDLIFSCDMLNMGYHIDDLTFVGMFRLTSSSNVFIQQFGRALSSGDLKPNIIFDWIDNIHSPNLYAVLGHESYFTTYGKNRLKELREKILDLGGESFDDISVLSEDEQKEYKRLSRRFGGNCDKEPWWTHSNSIEPEDIIVTPHAASYNEIIEKVIAEPLCIRIRQLLANWNEQRLLNEENPESPLSLRALLEAKAPKRIPIAEFAKGKKATVSQVLIYIRDNMQEDEIFGLISKELSEYTNENIENFAN